MRYVPPGLAFINSTFRQYSVSTCSLAEIVFVNKFFPVPFQWRTPYNNFLLSQGTPTY